MKKRLFALILAMAVMTSAVTASLCGCDISEIVDDLFGGEGGEGGEGGSQDGHGSCDGAKDSHKDEDASGLCDGCGESVTVVVDFYAINDLHGKFNDSDGNPGVDELTTYLKNAYKTDRHAIMLSSGDMWQGSAESNLTKGNIITEWMNELDFAAMTLGNHEYDWGEEYIEKNLELSEFPFLAINVYERATNARADYCAPSVMVERGGIKIGIIGAIGDCYSSISGEMREDVYFKVGDELTALVKAEADRLRSQGAEYIVYSLHDGYGSSMNDTEYLSGNQISSYYDVALSEGYVDLVFEGHTHQNYVYYDRYGVYHLQNGGDNEGISHIEVSINFANDTSKITEAEFVPTSRYATLADDEIVDKLLEKYKDAIAAANERLGYNSSYKNSCSLKQLVAELYLEAGLEAWGEEYNIVLGGGYISARYPYSLGVGDVYYSELMSIFPFDNQLVLCAIKGRYLKSRFLYTSNSDYFIAVSEYGEAIEEEIDDNATYYIITDTYCSTYAPNRLTEIARFDAGVYARDLVAEYIREGKMG